MHVLLLGLVCLVSLSSASFITRSVIPKRLVSIRRFSTHKDPFINFMATVADSSDLYSKQPTVNHNRFAAFTIAKAARNDPVLAEAMNFLAHCKGFKHWMPKEFVTDFTLSNEIEDVIKLDPTGRFLSVRNGLLRISRNQRTGSLSFYRPDSARRSLDLLPAFARLLHAQHAHAQTPISDLTVKFNDLSRIDPVYWKDFSPQKYVDYGLFLVGDAVVEGDYCVMAGMSRSQCNEFSKLLKNI